MNTNESQPGLGSGALREALELMVKEWHWYAGKHGLGPARLQYALGVGERALSLSSPIEPKHCNAPNPDGSYLCNKQPHSTGDHVHSFINPDKQNDFYFWPATPQASSEIREAKLNEADVVHVLEDMTAGVYWKEPDADGHVSRFTAQLNALLPPSRQGAAKRVEG